VKITNRFEKLTYVIAGRQACPTRAGMLQQCLHWCSSASGRAMRIDARTKECIQATFMLCDKHRLEARYQAITSGGTHGTAIASMTVPVTGHDSAASTTPMTTSSPRQGEQNKRTIFWGLQGYQYAWVHLPTPQSRPSPVPKTSNGYLNQRNAWDRFSIPTKDKKLIEMDP
jgi:hypothetical protein